ncbi:hypothetical protein [Herbaspirillum huttiense]|uniref:hypothetical protein n=1 Tax=Herbaspirillum huttiense TaxID=863372 RepID=UPI0039AFBD29
MDHPALSVVEEVCREFDGNGIFSVGANGALQAMALHWKEHLAEGHDVSIVTDDIDGMIKQLSMVSAEIARRLTGGITPSPVCGKCGCAVVADYCSDDTCPYSEWPQRVPIEDLQNTSADELRSRYEVLPRVRVHAEVHDDLRVLKVEFDAAAWFLTATDADIIKLHGIGWTGDYVSDSVAEHFEHSNDDISNLMAMCRATNGRREPVGFECSVDADSAMAWLQQHRPGVWARILCADNDVSLIEKSAKDSDVLPSWHWRNGEDSNSSSEFGTQEAAALNAVEILQLKYCG